MSKFLEDKDGNKSSKRLNQTLAVYGGLGIAVFAVFMAFKNGQVNMVIDIGMNITYLVMGLVGLGIGGGGITAFANRKPSDKKDK